MKKYLIAITMMLALGMNAQVAGQTHRHHNTASVTVPNDFVQQDEVEAFSDTTSAATGGDTVLSRTSQHGWSVTVNGTPVPDEEAEHIVNGIMSSVFDGLDSTVIGPMSLVLAVIVIMFVIAPVLIIGIILFFVYKNRKQRMRLAEAAMKSGQPIPDEFTSKPKPTEEDNDLRQKGIRQTCLGVGLMIFLGNTAGNIGLGIGALVTCIGIGNLLIARSQKKTDDLNRDLNHDLTEKDFER